jgi:hypothetical protein
MAIKVDLTEDQIALLIDGLTEGMTFENSNDSRELISYLERRLEDGKLPNCGHDACRS